MTCPGHMVRKWLSPNPVLLRRRAQDDSLGTIPLLLPVRRPSPASVLVAAETPKKPPGAKSRGPTSTHTSSGSLGVRPLFKDT